MAFSVAFLFVGRYLYTVGAGLHMWDVPYSDYSPAFLQTTVAATLTYAVSVSFSKLSILAFYLRVSPGQAFRRAVHALVALVCAYTLAYVLVMVFRCRPVAAGWDLSVKGGQCIGHLAPMMVLSVANIALDVVVLCLPIPVVAPLQMPLRQKVTLTLLFATGGFVVAAAIKRAVIMGPLLASPDYTWHLSQQFIWSFVEINAGIVCASLAALRPLFMRYIPFLVVSCLRPSQDHRRSRDRPGAAGKNTGSGSSALYGQAYELPSRDELPIQRPPATGDDDEARLWSRRHLCVGKAGSSQDSVRRRDRDSLDSLRLGDLYPGARPPVSAVSASEHEPHASQSTKGITVTKETLVSYGG
ncbi:Uncharacterized protein TPAR_02288 [Tolypocladium paradoxum]|uniref:Rhodopsin domain-containing protein n=1 Tax=Tolypocladium paradoxum TaxID=94208 RepID=A0A2S4L506_9HYPO|nr:Uncharacterized protein TPAR_02288 [Tolypocladium paradoxum]